MITLRPPWHDVFLALSTCVFRVSTEGDLQDSIARVLTGCGIDFDREVRLNSADVIDFVVGTTGIEVKIKGSLPALTRQLHRYAQHDRIQSLVVVTNRARLRSVPDVLNGKPVAVYSLLGSSL